MINVFSTVQTSCVVGAMVDSSINRSGLLHGDRMGSFSGLKSSRQTKHTLPELLFEFHDVYYNASNFVCLLIF